MLHKIDLGSEKAIGFSWEGKFDKKGAKQSVVQFLPELQARAHMNVYLEVYEITEVEALALWEEIKFDIKNYRELLTKIDKVALVTNVDWLRSLMETSYKLVPGIKFKAFDFPDKEAARVWAKENKSSS